MRRSRHFAGRLPVFLLVALLAVPAGLGASGEAWAQTAPFSLRRDTGPAIPAASDPERQRRLAAEEAPRVNSAGGAAATTAAPFDMNGDGGVPRRISTPEEEDVVLGASTIVSPLSGVGAPAPILAVDALTAEDQEALRRRLQSSGDVVREFRVVLPGGDVAGASEDIAVVDRPIVPAGEYAIDGEIGYVDWPVFVPREEATRPSTLAIGFTNSVVVLPEASRLDVFLNGRRLAETPIDSPDRTKLMVLPLPAGLLTPGWNTLRLAARMHHRVDCSVEATYELWTRFDPSFTGLSFAGGRPRLSGLGDLPGVGIGIDGMTRVRIVEPGHASLASVGRLLRVSQATALRGQFTAPAVEIAPLAEAPRARPGTLTVAIGSFDDLYRAMPTVPPEAESGPVTALIDAGRGGPTIFISGPNQVAVDQALDRFDAPQGLVADPRATAPTVLPGDAGFTLRQAGLESMDFAGRRFATHFDVTLPPDFYAAVYGDATLYLDAAYSSDVEAGSSVSILVNGLQSNSIALASGRGEVFDDYPISLALRNFHAGRNRITLVADLKTRADEACAPGSTVPSRDRFALFDTTRLVFGDFARVGQIPNLASFVADAFPYGRDGTPVNVAVQGGSPETVGAAGTLFAHLALRRGAPLDVAAVPDSGAPANEPLVVVAPYRDAPRDVLDATGAASAIPASWSSPGSFAELSGGSAGLDRYDVVLQRLRQQMGQGAADGLGGTAGAEVPRAAGADRDRWFETLNRERGSESGTVSGWLQRVRDVLDLDYSATRRDAERAAVTLPDTTTLVIAQASAPEASQEAWTLVTAPNAPLLSRSLASLGSRPQWNDVRGRLSGFDLANATVTSQAAGNVSYFATLPLTFGNIRLIAANWLSLNTGVYTVVLILVGCALGLLSWLLFRPMGRHN